MLKILKIIKYALEIGLLIWLIVTLRDCGVI